MSRLNKDCGHPSDWLFRVRMDGRTYTYCMGCLIEKNGLDNLEVYNNPYIKGIAKKVVKAEPKKEVKEKTNALVDEDIQTTDEKP